MVHQLRQKGIAGMMDKESVFVCLCETIIEPRACICMSMFADLCV